MEGRYYEFWVNGIIEENNDSIGVFHILADSQEEKVLEFHFLVTHSSKISEFNLENDGIELGKKLEGYILNVNETDHYYKLMKTVNEQFENFFSGEKIKKVFEFITASRDPFLKNVLIKDAVEEVFKKLYKKNNIKTEVKYSLVNPEENIMDIVTESNQDQVEKKATNLIKIRINPVLDPITGIPVNKLKVGDEVCFKVIDQNIDFSKLDQFVEKDDSDKTKRVYKGVLKSLVSIEGTESIQITVGLGDLYIGNCALQDELKIQANQVQIAEDINSGMNMDSMDDYDDEHGEEKMPAYIYAIIGGVGIIIIGVIYALFFA